MTAEAEAEVIAVSRDGEHRFSKEVVADIELVAGLGVRGDAHFGRTVQHRSRIAKTPDAPNLRQVHLVHRELLEWLRQQGFDVAPGDMGENIMTSGIELLALQTGTTLAIGETVVEVTGLRNPCKQLDNFQDGLMSELRPRGEDGEITRLAGVMAVVVEGGTVRAGDAITKLTLGSGALAPV